jgi:hypothetical protein
MTEWGIDTLFNPGKRHMDEEKRRLQSTREEIGDSSGGRRIDLESGTVTISRRPKEPPEADTEDAADTEDESAEGQSVDGQAGDEVDDNSETDRGQAVAADEAAAEGDRSASRE